MSSDTAVLSVATRHRRFPEGLDRLEASLARAGFEGRSLLWRGELPAGSPSHGEVPFAFKPYAFRAAAESGARRLLWLDAACVVVRDPRPLFDEMARRGVLLFRNGRARVGEWVSDDALAALGLDRETALGLPEVDAAAIGLDLGHATGRAFLDGWLSAAADGVAFRGTRAPSSVAAERGDLKWNRHGRASPDPRVRGHRHDQSVAGILAHRLGLAPREKGLQKISAERRWIRPGTVVAVDRDLSRLDRPVRSVAALRRDRWLGLLADLARRLRPPGRVLAAGPSR